jgi:hypothetical protein
MLRLAGRRRFLHQRKERFLQNVLGLAMAQGQGATVKNQTRRLGVEKTPAPMLRIVIIHDFKL